MRNDPGLRPTPHLGPTFGPLETLDITPVDQVREEFPCEKTGLYSQPGAKR